MYDFDSIDHPVLVPQERSEIPRLLRAVFDLVGEPVVKEILAFLDARDGEGFLRLEQAVLRAFAHAGSHVVAGVLGLLHHDEAWREVVTARERHRGERRLRHRGWRTTPVRFLGGATLTVRTPYLSEDRRGRPGRRRRVGRRGAAGSGVYPALAAVGITRRATPALVGEVTRQSVRTASFEEAREALAERGVRMSVETVRHLTLEVGREALHQRESRLELAERGVVLSREFAGRRVVLSTDGGRLRVREGGRRGRRGKSGRRRFRTPWREPKLVTAYVVDERGRKRRDTAPLYDGTLEDADAAFRILAAELKLRGAADAREIVVVADGARWIWNRVEELARFLGIDPARIVRVADFYHAVEHLAAIAELRAGWDDSEKRRWVRRMRRHLKKGKVDTVIAEAKTLCRGRRARAIRVHVRYFQDRRESMRYDEFARRGIPLGSGGVESAIRRVVNLRLKGASIFWRGPNAEAMLHLRSYLKAGRWDELMGRVMHRAPYATAPMSAPAVAA